MKAASRIGKVEARLTPKQMVLLDLQEARTHPTMEAHAAAIAAMPVFPRSLCERIEDSIERAELDHRQHAARVRAAIREGLFLAHLAKECNVSLIAEIREWGLMNGFLWMQGVCLVSQDMTDEAETLWRAGEWSSAIETLFDRMTSTRDAVRLVEREFFDGIQILYPRAELEMEKAIESLRHTLSRATDLRGLLGGENDGLRHAGKTRRSSRNGSRSSSRQVVETNKAASKLAQHWLIMARARVLDAMGETRRGIELVRSVLTERASGSEHESCAS